VCNAKEKLVTMSHKVVRFWSDQSMCTTRVALHAWVADVMASINMIAFLLPSLFTLLYFSYTRTWLRVLILYYWSERSVCAAWVALHTGCQANIVVTKLRPPCSHITHVRLGWVRLGSCVHRHASIAVHV
jgi:hypothetical protein